MWMFYIHEREGMEGRVSEGDYVDLWMCEDYATLDVVGVERETERERLCVFDEFCVL